MTAILLAGMTVFTLCGTINYPIYLPGVPTPIVEDDGDMHMLPIDLKVECENYTVGGYGRHVCTDKGK